MLPHTLIPQKTPKGGGWRSRSNGGEGTGQPPPQRTMTTLERRRHQFERELAELKEQLVDFRRDGLSMLRLELAERDWAELRDKRERVDQAYDTQARREVSEDRAARLEVERDNFYEKSGDRLWR